MAIDQTYLEKLNSQLSLAEKLGHQGSDVNAIKRALSFYNSSNYATTDQSSRQETEDTINLIGNQFLGNFGSGEGYKRQLANDEARLNNELSNLQATENGQGNREYQNRNLIKSLAESVNARKAAFGESTIDYNTTLSSTEFAKGMLTPSTMGAESSVSNNQSNATGLSVAVSNSQPVQTTNEQVKTQPTGQNSSDTTLKKVNNMADWQALQKQGITENDITRVGSGIYIKPTSKFYNSYGSSNTSTVNQPNTNTPAVVTPPTIENFAANNAWQDQTQPLINRVNATPGALVANEAFVRGAAEAFGLGTLTPAMVKELVGSTVDKVRTILKNVKATKDQASGAGKTGYNSNASNVWSNLEVATAESGGTRASSKVAPPKSEQEAYDQAYQKTLDALGLDTASLKKITDNVNKSSEAMYKELLNSPEIVQMQKDVTDKVTELNKLNALEMDYANQIRSQADGEVSNTYLQAKVAELSKELYPKKLTLQADIDNLNTKLSQQKEVATNILKFKLQDQSTQWEKTKAVLDAAKEAGKNAMTAFKDSRKEELDILNVQKDIPIGETFDYAGATYKGLKQNDTVKTIEITEAGGKKYIVAVDPQTGVTKYKTFVGIEKGPAGGSTSDDEKITTKFYADIDLATNNLQAGQWDYGQAYNYVVGKYGQPTGGVDKNGQNSVDILLNKSKWGQAGAYEKDYSTKAKLRKEAGLDL